MHAFIDFALEIDKLKAVTRKVKPIGLDRYENPAEHTWQVALLAAAFADQAVEPVDVSTVIGMLLMHDVGEIDTGDTMVFHEAGLADRKVAERAAVVRILQAVPESRRRVLMALWDEFEAEVSPEARFAHALDRAMPVILNLNNSGQSWLEHGITHARVVARVGPQVEAGCPALWAYLKQALDQAQDAGWFGTAGPRPNGPR